VFLLASALHFLTARMASARISTIVGSALAIGLSVAGCQSPASLTTADARRPAKVGHQPRIITASWYGPHFHGHRTSNGEIFSQYRLTAASRTLPMNSMVKVTNLDNGKSVVVRINDRGPYVGNRAIDLSRAAARKIGLTHKGTGTVKIALLRHPPLPAQIHARASQTARGDGA
jgi:rare lipoprotein A (peptidoglycan hydrolase)